MDLLTHILVMTMFMPLALGAASPSNSGEPLASSMVKKYSGRRSERILREDSRDMGNLERKKL